MSAHGWLILTVLVAMAGPSVGAAQEPAEERRPKVELSAGTWLSVGDTRWAHNASSVAGLGNPTSKLIYKDVGTNVVDLAGKFWLSPKVFGKLNVGIADIGGGRLIDDDYGTGQQLFSRTQSDINNNSMWYINVDLGARVKEFANHRGYVDVFGGYQYWHTEYQAVSLGQPACNPSVIPGLTCAPAGTNSLQGVKVITNTTDWHSLRVGGTAEYFLTRRFSVNGTFAFIPVSLLDNRDIHHQRGDLQQNPSFSMKGLGIGANLDVGLKYLITRHVAATVGYRLYYNRLVDGDFKTHPVSGGESTFPLTQFESLRHGLTAGLTLLF
jgi:hypothetical protein